VSVRVSHQSGQGRYFAPHVTQCTATTQYHTRYVTDKKLLSSNLMYLQIKPETAEIERGRREGGDGKG